LTQQRARVIIKSQKGKIRKRKEVKKMTLEEMRVVDALVVEMFGEDGLTADECEDVCEVCPFAERCGREELYFGCGVWEEMMGEDL